jgi:glycerophosphoryl diester phosphodiesterase
MLALALGSGQQGGRAVGVYIETKDPAFHRSVGLPLEGKVVDALVHAGFREQPSAPIILQSFEEQVYNPVAQTCCESKSQIVYGTYPTCQECD